MKILTVCTGWVSHTNWIRDDAKADAAYEAIRKAVAEYERFKNERQEIITVDCGDSTASYKVENIVMFNLDTISSEAEETVVEKAVWDARVKARVAALTAPAE